MILRLEPWTVPLLDGHVSRFSTPLRGALSQYAGAPGRPRLNLVRGAAKALCVEWRQRGDSPGVQELRDIANAFRLLSGPAGQRAEPADVQ
eukprot:10112561-Alexandrium_andersonii.AAC.1